MWGDRHVWLSVNILLSYFGPFCWELMPTPTPSFLGLGAMEFSRLELFALVVISFVYTALLWFRQLCGGPSGPG